MAIFTRKFKRKIKIIFALLAPIAALLGYAFFIEPNTLKTEHRAFKLDCLKQDISEKFVQISDLHFTGQTKDDRIDQIYDAIKNINPKAIFMTGDYVSEKEGLAAAEKLVRKISENFSVYVVFGNWDYSAFDYNIGELRAAMEKAGAKAMINDAASLDYEGVRLNLLGVKDPYTSGDTKGDLEKAAGKISGDKNDCIVLLAHSPDIIKTAKDDGIDLVLAGHTHGGQVYLPYFTERYMPISPEGKGYIEGLYKIDKTQMYVNRGIGLSIFPFRMGVPPELMVFTLEKGG